MIETLIIVTLGVAVVLAVLTYRLEADVRNCELMCLELNEAIAEMRYSHGHPATRPRQVFPPPDPPYDPFSDQGVLG